MTTNDAQTGDTGKAPVVGGKIAGRAKQIDGRLSEFDGKTFGDPEEQLEGTAEVVAGRIQEAVGKAEGEVIASAEKQSYQDVWEGRAAQVEGAAKQAAGKVVAGWGRLTGQPDTELKGMAEQVEGAAEKAVGGATKDAAKQSLSDAVAADQDYVTGRD